MGDENERIDAETLSRQHRERAKEHQDAKSLKGRVSAQAVRETLGFIGVVVSLVFVGTEIRQNTMVARASAYQEIGFETAEAYRVMALDRDWAKLNVLGNDSSRWDEIDETGWLQLKWRVIGRMRAWETVYLQIQQGLLPRDAIQRFGYDVNPRLYWPYFDKMWPEIRGIVDKDFATYIESRFGTTPRRP